MGLKVVRRWFFGLDLLLCRGKVVTVPVQTQGLGSDHGLAARKQPNLTHSELLRYRIWPLSCCSEDTGRYHQEKGSARDGDFLEIGFYHT